MSTPSRPDAIPALTAIRGIAALVVVVFHVHETFPKDDLFVVSWFRNGGFGVDLFFVLSGFIMAHVYMRQSRVDGFAAFATGFLKARLARIYPLHLATLLATVALVLWLPGFAPRYQTYFGVDSFVLNLLLMQNWGFIGPSWNMVSWSISAEWFMYLVFPLLLWAYAKRVSSSPRSKQLAFSLMAVLAGTYVAIIVSRGWNHYGGMSSGGMVRVFFEFVLGFLVYQVRDTLHPPPGTMRFEIYGAALVALAALALFDRRYWHVFVPAIALLIATLGTNRGAVSQALSRRAAVYLGEISFSLYMWHWLVIQIHNVLRDAGTLAVQDRAGLYLQSASMVALSLAAAALSHPLIEKPAREWINRTGKRRPPGARRPPRPQAS
ncbi:acyltransferase [Pseudorhodoferax sp. Leaf265]|uniref:acyltransferase family protein n=1 Tax=Pseudorhodoferax sp. Leaf265 TaxID=1736315 RepID=UPI0007016856|nr:acyltransferase [Pseudorhodoferax sp. Leaf265]KQP09027.1 hypothetical protein ASF45_08130 [Pseudorhodoferax sp. Leaf265]